MSKKQHAFICDKCHKKMYSNIKNRIICQKCIVNDNKISKANGLERQTKLL